MRRATYSMCQKAFRMQAHELFHGLCLVLSVSKTQSLEITVNQTEQESLIKLSSGFELTEAKKVTKVKIFENGKKKLKFSLPSIISLMSYDNQFIIIINTQRADKR